MAAEIAEDQPLSEPGLRLIKSYTQTGAAGQNIDLADLDVNAYKLFTVIVNYIEGHLGGSTLALYFNGDYVAANYYNQSTFAIDAAAYSFLHANTAQLTTLTTLTTRIRMILHIGRDVTGYAHCRGILDFLLTYAVGILRRAGLGDVTIVKMNAPVANITAIRIAGTSVDSIGVGTTVEVYGYKGA